MMVDWLNKWLIKLMYPHRPDKKVTSVVQLTVDELLSLPPGRVEHLTLTDHGEDFAIMHWDDFEHIMKLAGCKPVEPESVE